LAVINRFFEDRLDQLFELAEIAQRVFAAAGAPYRIVGGLAVYLYVESVEPDAGRLTRDVDVLVNPSDLERIRAAAPQFGLELRHTAGVDMLVPTEAPSARRAVHFVLSGSRVRPGHLLEAPEIGDTAAKRLGGLDLVPLSDLVRMKLTSFRLKDQTHLKDLELAGLLTADVTEGLPPELRQRLDQVFAAE
jgi:hypothetical protein